MKALTVRQPWAWAIINYGKDVENRTRRTTHRGLLAIHASLTFDTDAWQGPLFAESVRGRLLGHLPRVEGGGVVIGVVDVVGCHYDTASPDDHCPGGCVSNPWSQRDTWHWVLSNPRPLAEPIPYRGRLGIFTLPGDIAAAIHAQTGATP